MKSKASSLKSAKIKTRKKISLLRIMLIVAVVIITASFLIFSVYYPSGKQSEKVKTISSQKSAPTFSKECDLEILLSGGSEPLRLDIEIADNEAERMRGLMDRFTLPEMAGMLFIFDKDEMRSFWMKNTYIPLDIIYIDSQKKIVSIQKYTQPKTTFSIPSEEPAMYVLEVNAGFCDKYNVNPGDRIGFSYH